MLATLRGLAGCDRLESPEVPRGMGIVPANAAPAKSRESLVWQVMRTYPKDEYERAVTCSYELMYAPDATQKVCARWYPDYARSTVDALVAWEEAQQPLMLEIRGHARAMWVRQAEGEAGVVAPLEARYAYDRFQTYQKDFDRTPNEQYRKRCADFPKMLASPQWNLSKRFRQELALMRRHPLVEAASGMARAASP